MQSECLQMVTGSNEKEHDKISDLIYIYKYFGKWVEWRDKHNGRFTGVNWQFVVSVSGHINALISVSAIRGGECSTTWKK